MNKNQEVTKMKRTFLSVFFLFFLCTTSLFAKEETELYDKRLQLYKKYEATSFIPWYYLAAIDQYERNIHPTCAKKWPVISICFDERAWVGPLNPNEKDGNLSSISFFNGLGVDGNGDQKATIDDDEDRLYALVLSLSKHSHDLDYAVWNRYKRDKAVSIIKSLAKLYNEVGHVELTDRAFPVPLRANYSYRSTWGDRRGFGGLRIHEGTDIFANYGVPVRSTTYGVIEMKGWNRYGGWRIGIRDSNQIYHYYAHLQGFEKGIEEGDVVTPGQVIGYVGSSGYGPPGTQGKFPPHLHYGMYKDDGIKEWSFDPYPSLRMYEQIERKKRSGT